MDELFSCRNCANNCAQSLTIGNGPGYCLKHDTLLFAPERSTCKYLHRKDLPGFVVDEGVREHAAEFAVFSRVADLRDKRPVPSAPYSERRSWEGAGHDGLVDSLAKYHRVEPRWVFINAMEGGIDGRRSLAHASLARRYMAVCDTWRSSYRFALSIIQELHRKALFSEDQLVRLDAADPAETREEANWDVFFSRLAFIQEYGYHAGIEEMMWATDALNGSLSSLDWQALSLELPRRQEDWSRMVVEHAKNEGQFFTQVSSDHGREVPLD